MTGDEKMYKEVQKRMLLYKNHLFLKKKIRRGDKTI